MRFSVASLGLLITAALLPAQQPSQKASVGGTVVSSSGAPVKKADVMLNRMDKGGSPNSLASTDSEGRFLFPSVEPGRYSVFAQKAGFISSTAADARARRNTMVSVTAGQQLGGVTLTLYPQGVISGRVIDEDGDPLHNVSVQVAGYTYVRGRRQLTSRGSAMTNDIGEYRLAGLMPGKYVVYATRPGSFQTFSEGEVVEEGYPVTFYPNLLDANQAMLLESTAGSDLRGVDIRMRKVRTFHIRGQITDYAPSEKAGPHFGVYVTRTSGGFGIGGPGGGSPVAADGSFDIAGLVPGSYTVVAMRMVQGYSTMTTSAVELGNRNVDGVMLTLGDGINLKGVLRFEGAPQDATKLRVTLDAVDNPILAVPNAQNAKADGSFTIQGASPAKFRVSVFGLAPNSYVKSVQAGQREVLENGLDLTAGSPGDLDVLISDKAAKVSGVVVDDKQQRIADGIVILLGDGARRGQARFTRSTNSGADGSFTFSGLTPGDYLLLAAERLEDGSWQDPEFLQRYETKAVKLKLSEGATENVQVTAERTTP